MRVRKNLNYSSEQLDEMIAVLVTRRERMQKRMAEMESGLFTLERQLKSLYAKRTIALNFTLPLEETK
jgi:hypothetical protein